MLSVDGVGAFDLISRAAMMTALRDAPDCDPALPFVLQFYGRPSMYFREDDLGEVHEILQGEGGEQGRFVRTRAAQGFGRHSEEFKAR